ncbi:MAG TPA: VanZ family protein [Chthoniobacteraceae bacterium]|nr:VanZ family protein [Chthoniobacteraceae bacterium]
MKRAFRRWVRLPAAWHWVVVLLWAATIYWLSSQSGDELPDVGFTIPHFDKFAHFVAYACGGALMALAFWRSSFSWKGAIIASIVLLALFGGSDEWHQLSTPGRTGGDVFDWLADLLGAVAGSVFIALYVRTDPAHAAGGPRRDPLPPEGTPGA